MNGELVLPPIINPELRDVLV